MQAISTKYAGATNFRGGRIIATSGGGHRLTVSWDHALNIEDNHKRAAHELMRKLGWEGRIVGGSTKNGYCWVFTGGSRDARRGSRDPKPSARRRRARSRARSRRS